MLMLFGYTLEMSTTHSRYFTKFKETACKVPVLGLLVQAGLRGSKSHIKDLAASIAFFCFLSLFPLLLGLTALAGSILKSERLRLKIIEWVDEFFPVGADFITQNLESLVRMRGAASLASVVVLFWSARKLVGAISRGTNSVLEQKRDHTILLSPFRNFALVLFLSLLMIFATAISPLADVISNLEPRYLGQGWLDFINLIGGHIVSGLSTGVLIACSYFLLPYQRPTWGELWPGLVFATILVELGKKAFVFYVDNISSMDAIYGSISSIIVLMLWLYFFARVFLFGAEVNYVYNSTRKTNNPNKQVITEEKTK